MNYEAIMQRMNSFFAQVSPDVIIEALENKGYVLDDLPTEINHGSYVTQQPKDIGNNGEYISSPEKRASTTCSFFLYLIH